MILSRVKFYPQERLDLEDILTLLSAARTDAKLWTKEFLSSQNYVLKGFGLSGIGVNHATLAMTDSSFIIGGGTSDYSYFIAEPGASDINIPTASLVAGVRNYVELSLGVLDGTPVTKAFWDPSANGGLGAEFNQTVNTVTNLQASAIVLTGGFTGLPDRIPVGIIDVDSLGTIKVIFDQRNLFWRQGTPANPANAFTWASQQEPTYAVNITSPTGTFVAGETVTFTGGVTATVAVGGTTDIQIRLPSGINFTTGNTITGGTSLASGTVNTIAESFTGADKDIVNSKENDMAIKEEIRRLKGTTFWYQLQLNSNQGLSQQFNSVVVPVSGGAAYTWDGSSLSISDANVSPSPSDILAKIRIFGSAGQLSMERADGQVGTSKIPLADGQILFVQLPAMGASRSYSGNGSGATNYQVASISSFVISDQNYWLAYREGAKVSLRGGSDLGAVPAYFNGIIAGTSTTVTLTAVTAGIIGNSINLTFNGSTTINAEIIAWNTANPNNQVSLTSGNGTQTPSNGANAQLANGAGESAPIGDDIPTTLLANIGLVDEETPANYSSNIRGTNGESLVSRLGVLTDAVGDEQEDRSGYLRSDQQVTWDGTNLTFTADLVLEFINTKSGTVTQHKILQANSPIAISNGQSIYGLINRASTLENITPINSGSTPIPAQVQAEKDVFIFFRRVDAGGVTYLHLPFMKQLIAEGQTVRLGQSGSGSSIVKATSYNPTSTTLPTGTSVTTDGVIGSNGDTILFTNLSSGNNEIYTLSGVGTAIAWTPLRAFNGQFLPTQGDTVRILKGTGFADQNGEFNGTTFKFNDVVRHFSGTDYWEISSLKTATLADNSTATVFSLTASGSENMIMDYAILRNGQKETGTLYITQDGTNVNLASVSAFTSTTAGVTFSAAISVGILTLSATTDMQSVGGQIKYSLKRWSDLAGGPGGPPSYSSGGGGGGTGAAGGAKEIQFNAGAGVFGSDSRFLFDASKSAVVLNGLEFEVLTSGLVLLDNQVTPQTLFTMDQTAYQFAIVEYSIRRGSNAQVGRLLIVNDGTNVSLTDDFTLTNPTGITFSAMLSGGFVQVQYVSTNTATSGTFKCSKRKWN